MKVNSESLLKMMSLINEISRGAIEFEDISKSENGDDLDFYGIDDLVSAGEVLNRIIDQDEVRILFPGEEDYFSFTVAEFIAEAAECVSIQIDKNSIIHTPNLAIQLVTPMSEKAHLACYHSESLSISTEIGARVQIKYSSIPVAVHSANNNTYEARELGVLTAFTLIEVDFSNFQGQRSEQVASDLISTYLFELSSSQNIVFGKSDFIYEENEIAFEESEKFDNLIFKPLELCNEGIHLYLAASEVTDLELRFFSFYKVLEYFAPIVLSLEVHEEIRKKLDSHQSLKPDGQFISEIIQISKCYDLRRNDREQIKSLLLASVDLTGLNQEVPANLQESHSHLKDKKNRERYARNLAECICATRNQVAHAKANYEPTGTECPYSELETFTRFVELAASETIRWYNRLPDHQKTTNATS